MLPVTSKQIVEFTPNAAKDRDPLPVFKIQVATLVARAQWRREVAEAGARFPTNAELLDAIRDDLKAVNPDNLARLLDEVDTYEALSDEDKAEPGMGLGEIAELCRGMGGAFARGVAARGYWTEIAPLLAAHRFVVDWTNAGVEYRRGRDGVAPDVLDQLPEAWVKQVGWKAIELLSLDKATEKTPQRRLHRPKARRLRRRLDAAGRVRGLAHLRPAVSRQSQVHLA